MKAYYGRKSWDVVGYTYNAEMYCTECAPEPNSIDNDGNVANLVFADEVTESDVCAECGEVL